VIFTDGMLRLARIGARARPDDAPYSNAPVATLDRQPVAVASHSAAGTPTPSEERTAAREIDRPPEAEGALAEELADFEGENAIADPALGDLEAAVALVAGGLATRVVLTGFRSWPGLLWHAYQLAEVNGVLILPTVVRPGGRVDIAITRGDEANV
jgi:hypothetical protein